MINVEPRGLSKRKRVNLIQNSIEQCFSHKSDVDRSHLQQESIPARMRTAHLRRPYVFQYPLDVSIDWGPEVNKFQQVSSLHQQMSLAGGEEMVVGGGSVQRLVGNGNGHMGPISPEQND